MKIRFSPDLLKTLRKIKHNDKKLLAQIQKQIKLFQDNPKYQSLRIHKLSGKYKNRWSISVNKSVRIVFILLNEDEAYFITIGTHDEVYRKLQNIHLFMRRFPDFFQLFQS